MDLNDIDTERLLAELARRDFKTFVKYFWHTIEPGNAFIEGIHVDAISLHLTHALELERLIINTSRRHTKSLLASVFYPAWLWLADPSVRFICASHSLQLARDLSIKCRTLVRSELYQRWYGESVKIVEDNDTIGKFTNGAGGYRLVASASGRTTGAGANIIIFDDPNDISLVSSEADRQSTIDYWRTTLSQTINPGRAAARIIVQQRCHPEDLTGWLLDHEGDLWTHLCLPFEYNPEKAKPTSLWKDPRTEPGEPLSTLLSDREIGAKKRDVVTWQTQFNQNPILVSDQNFFQKSWFRYFSEEDEDSYLLETNKVKHEECWRFATVDPSAFDAVSGKKGDFTAIGIFAVTPGSDLLLLHLVKRRLETTEIVPELVRLHRRHELAFIGIEDTSVSRALIQYARRERLPVRPLKAYVKKQAGEGAKEARAFDLQTRLANGQVYFLKGAAWLADLELELLEFPNSKYDDQVDVLSYGAMQVSRCRPREVEEQVEPTAEEQRAEALKRYNDALTQGLF